MKFGNFRIIFAIVIINLQTGSALCYFPVEIQGVYVTQSTTTGTDFVSKPTQIHLHSKLATSMNSSSEDSGTSNDLSSNMIQYSEINIIEDSIPILGVCYRRLFNNNLILMMTSEETTCYRCLNMQLVARNIIRFLAGDKDFLFKCAANEEKAIKSCPKEQTNDIYLTSNASKTRSTNQTAPQQYHEVILYKKLTYDGGKIRGEYCPFNGPYKIVYNTNQGSGTESTATKIQCTEASRSILDNCPSGSAINLRLRGCSIQNHDIVFECLGHWKNDEKNFIALKSLHSHYSINHNDDAEAGDEAFARNRSGQIDFGPEYRCAIFREIKTSGDVVIEFSKDSNCNFQMFEAATTTNISVPGKYHQPNDELILRPMEMKLNNRIKKANLCKFPMWFQGDWEHLGVANETLIYRDPNSYKSYTMECIQNTIDDSYLVYSRTQCGEEMLQCIKVKRRDKNIIEFQIGSEQKTASIIHNNADDMVAIVEQLCNTNHFSMDNWLTQGREDIQYKYSECPIDGVYHGVIPDAPNLCAKLQSNCKSKDLMYYEVFSCEFNEVYEERKYRCLGQWKNNKFVYTYTKRLDVLQYECFIGAHNTDDIIFIKEAGENCRRLINPLKHGMKLNKYGFCDNQANLIYDETKYIYSSNARSAIANNMTATTNGNNRKKFDHGGMHVSKPHSNMDKNEIFVPPPSHIISAILTENNKLPEQMLNQNKFMDAKANQEPASSIFPKNRANHSNADYIASNRLLVDAINSKYNLPMATNENQDYKQLVWRESNSTKNLNRNEKEQIWSKNMYDLNSTIKNTNSTTTTTVHLIHDDDNKMLHNNQYSSISNAPKSHNDTNFGNTSKSDKVSVNKARKNYQYMILIFIMNEFLN